MTLKVLKFSHCSVDFELINTKLVKKSLNIVFISVANTHNHIAKN